MVWIFLLAWLIGTPIGYALFKREWLREYDFTRADRRFFVALALLGGPISIGTALLVWVLNAQDKTPRGREVLHERVER